jgi:hypothetical protein
VRLLPCRPGVDVEPSHALERGRVEVRDLLQAPGCNHAPAAALDAVEAVDLEARTGAGTLVELGAGVGPEHDRITVEGVVDRNDERRVGDHDGEPSDLVGCEQPQAFVAPEDLEAVVGACSHGPPSSPVRAIACCPRPSWVRARR